MNNAFSPFIPLSVKHFDDPALGEVLFFPIPNNEIWILHSFYGRINTSAAVGNRYAYLSLSTAGGINIIPSPTSNAIGPTTLLEFNVSSFPDIYYDPAGIQVFLPFPQFTQFPPGYYFNFSLLNIDPDDQISNCYLSYFKIVFNSQ